MSTTLPGQEPKSKRNEEPATSRVSPNPVANDHSNPKQGTVHSLREDDPRDSSLEAFHSGRGHTGSTSTSHPQEAKTRWLKRTAGLAAIVGSFLAGRYVLNEHTGPHDKATLPQAAGSIATSDTVVVTASPTVERNVVRSVKAVGTLHAFEEVLLSSKVEGRVTQIFHDTSSVVRPGDVLVQLDDTDAKLAVDQAERNLSAELAKWGFPNVPEEKVDLSQLPAVVSARVKLDLAISRLQRMEVLRASQSISADDFDQARSEAKVLEVEWKNQQLQAASAAAVARLRAADLAIARQRLVDCQIRAPQPSLVDSISSPEYVVSDRLVSEGNLLRPGSEVVRLVLGKTLKLRLLVPETASSGIALGQEVEVKPSALNQVVMGRVTNIAPSIDRTTRTLSVEVQVPNNDGAVRPGGFAKANIIIGHAEHAITAPASSIYALAGVQKIFVLENDRVQEHHVVLGEQDEDWVEIVEPKLNPGVHVVTSGHKSLFDGAKVAKRSEQVAPESSSTEK